MTQSRIKIQLLTFTSKNSYYPFGLITQFNCSLLIRHWGITFFIYILRYYLRSLIPTRIYLLYSTNQGLDTAVPVLLVDGYNVCGYWAKLKKHFTKGRLDIARQKLIDELIAFSVIKGLVKHFSFSICS